MQIRNYKSMFISFVVLERLVQAWIKQKFENGLSVHLCRLTLHTYRLVISLKQTQKLLL